MISFRICFAACGSTPGGSCLRTAAFRRFHDFAALVCSSSVELSVRSARESAMSEVSLSRLAVVLRRAFRAGVSNEEEDRSDVGGEDATPARASLLLLPGCVVAAVLVGGVRVELGLLAESAEETPLRGAMAESDDVFLPEGRLLPTSDKPVSPSERSLNRLVCGVCGGAVLRRGGGSRTGDLRSGLSRSASEFRALDAALTEIGEGRL